MRHLDVKITVTPLGGRWLKAILLLAFTIKHNSPN